MQNKYHWISRVLLGTYIFVGFISVAKSEGLPPLTHNLTAVKKPYIAPALRLLNLDDETVDLKDLKGKVVIVNFWATWCPPCRREMGSIESLYQALNKDSNNKKVEVLAVNIGEDNDTVFSFTGTIEPSPTFTMLLDLDAVTMKQWNVKGLPTTFVIDTKGKVVYRAVGGREFDHPDMIKQIKALVTQ